MSKDAGKTRALVEVKEVLQRVKADLEMRMLIGTPEVGRLAPAQHSPIQPARRRFAFASGIFIFTCFILMVHFSFGSFHYDGSDRQLTLGKVCATIGIVWLSLLYVYSWYRHVLLSRELTASSARI